MTTIIDGKEIARQIKTEITEDIKRLKKTQGIVPGLATILVGQDPASQVYIKNKIKATEQTGILSFHHQFENNITQEKIISLIASLNQDPKVHGILVQMPLPKHIDPDLVINAIDPKKDVDGFHPQNMGRLLIGQPGLQPCTPLGVMELLKRYHIELAGKDVLIIGRSNIVGKPQALMMLKQHATVTLAHSRTHDLNQKAKLADVIVAAVGKAKLIKADWIKPGAVVIDVGMNRLLDGSLCGDVDYEEVKLKAGFITPVPGGVGPMTIAMLMKNTLQAAYY